MKKRKCSKCGELKLINEYKRTTDSWCTICTNQYTDEYSKLHKKEKKEYDKIYHQNNKERDGKRSRNWRLNNPEYGKNAVKEWRKRNPGYGKKWSKEYNSRRDVKDRRNKRLKEKRETDVSFKLSTDIATTMRRSLKGKKNRAPWETLVDYDTNELKKHFESLFTEGMSWDNYGRGKYEWSLDHKIPICKWNITSNECQALKDCWALDNLQPLWHVRNMEKGTRPMEPKYLIKPF